MIKLYLSSVLIWFLIIMSFSIATKELFLKNVERIEKELNEPPKKKWGYIKTTVYYMLFSFVPFYRFLILIAKLLIVFNVEKVIEKLKEGGSNE